MSGMRVSVPAQFKLGQGEVIKGWDDGLRGMCIGEKRKLTIPSDLAYGDDGSGDKIPGGSTLQVPWLPNRDPCPVPRDRAVLVCVVRGRIAGHLGARRKEEEEEGQEEQEEEGQGRGVKLSGAITDVAARPPRVRARDRHRHRVALTPPRVLGCCDAAQRSGWIHR